MKAKSVHAVQLAVGVALLVMPAVLAAPRNARVVSLENARAAAGPWTTQGSGYLAFDHEKGKRAGTLRLDDSSMPHYCVRGEVQFPSAGSSFAINVGAKEVEDPRRKVKREKWSVSASIAARLDGEVLRLYTGRSRTAMSVRGTSDVGAGWYEFSVLRVNDHVQITFAGNRMASKVVSSEERALLLTLSNGAKIRNLEADPLSTPSAMMVPIVLDQLSNTSLAPDSAADENSLGLVAEGVPTGLKVIDGVPFALSRGALDVSPSMAGVQEPLRVKSVYNNPATAGKYGRLVTSVPSDLYTALHVVACSRELEGAVPRMTVRLGVGGYSAVFEDTPVQIPDIRGSDQKNPHVRSRIPVKLEDGAEGYLYHVRIPLAKSANVMWETSQRFPQATIEFTRDVNVHVKFPDPYEFTVMPSGPPSSVVMLGATLEKSPLAVSYATDEPANIFYEDQAPIFHVSLTNRSGKAISGQVVAKCAGPGTKEESRSDHTEWQVTKAYRLQPDETQKVSIDVTPKLKKRGWYACSIGVTVGRAIVQERDTTFAILAPDIRRARTDSPFGTWAWLWAHNIFPQEDQWHTIASIVKKGGWRWAMAGPPTKKNRAPVTPDDYQWFTETYLYEYNMCTLPMSARGMPAEFKEGVFKEKVLPSLKRFETYGTHAIYKVLHENRSSGALLLRFNEFLGGDLYDMPEDEDERVKNQFDYVVKYCRAIKKAVPGAKIVLINDYPAVGIEYMKRGVPKDAFDYFGSEGAMFMREPERQPDWLSLLGNMHTWNRARKKYGYEDKPVWTTEALYHSTNPGNLTLHKQAVIYAREAMLALALGVGRIHGHGSPRDYTSDYRWSNWGMTGFCFRDPEFNPKPSFCMMSWVTQVLDQAEPAGFVKHDSTSLHVLDYAKEDGSHVYPSWVVRGVQKVTLKVQGGEPTVYDCYGNVVEANLADGQLSLPVSNAPSYVTGTIVEGVMSRESVEMQREGGGAIMELDDPEQLQVVDARSETLEGNFDYPRLKGQFSLEHIEEDGATAVKVSLQKDDDPRKLLQRYVELKLAQPIELPGRPYAITARVKGNGGWGKIMFELIDVKGRVWTSCGSQGTGGVNSSDCKGDSFVSFDGWETMQIPLPGQYPGQDQFVAWPRNFDWWPENTPEWVEAQKQHEDATKEYEEKLKEHEQAQAGYDTALQGYEAAKKAGDKKAKHPGKPPRKPREPVLRNYGAARVDYPVKLTKLIIAMPPHILYITEELLVANPTILIDRLDVIQPPEGM